MTMRFRLGLLVGGLLAATVMGTSLIAQGAGMAKTPGLTEKEFVALLESAKTPADHGKLAAYYEEEALDFEAKANKHKLAAAAYRRIPASGNPRTPTPNWAQTAVHCDNIAADAAKAGKEAHTMADHHKMLAKDATTAH